jgi:YegS/Rv2252/BmrU family lipid kinase
VTRRFVLLVNPAAAGGRALKALPAVIAELDAHGAEHRTVTTRSMEHAAKESARAAEAGETIAALGGDGLLRPIAGAISGRDTAVALVPCGRGNDLAMVLGVPEDPARAARLAVRGEERLVDVASVDGTPYLGIASLGIDSDANQIANDARLLRGDAVYFYAGLRALAAWRPAAFTVTVDGDRHEFTGYSVAVGNSRAYGGGMMLLPHAELDDGKLDVLMIEHYPKLRLLRDHLPGVYRGTHLQAPHHLLARGEVVEVQSDRQFAVYADGDPIGATPATMRVKARALRVIGPPEA